ncbi:hypothetical protein [Gymnodinialimonas hymeniacidonis]|uniref:hypothetical protein n=1 Tax=Gymnodinialimonas hymeniacidonis TaxID=3126508 RepID=UPI0034C5CA24
MRVSRFGFVITACLIGVASLCGFVTQPADQPLMQRAAVAEPVDLEAADWAEFCETTDCSQIPEGYTTYVLAPHTYYFPSNEVLSEQFPQITLGFAVPRDFVDRRADGSIRRSFSHSSRLRIRACCNAMLAHYGLIDADALSENSVGPGVSGWMRLYAQSWFAVSDHSGGLLSDFISADQRSYNDDFWLIEIGDLTGPRQVRSFTVLSKTPLLNGYRVLAHCTTYCDIETVAFEADAENTRPHVVMDINPRQGLGSAARLRPDYEWSLFRCAPEALGDGCDPAVAIFDELPRMLGLLDTMFEMAQVHPSGLTTSD